MIQQPLSLEKNQCEFCHLFLFGNGNCLRGMAFFCGRARLHFHKDNAVTIHAVTFTEGAVQQPMKNVAREGDGQHFHANDGIRLVEIFEEIANNLPTILTE